MNQEIEIETKRLILKGISPAFIHQLFQSKTKQQIINFFGVDENGYNHFKNMHENGMETFRISQFFFLLINKETHLPIGDCGFHTWNKTHNRAELYYGLRNEKDKQQGFMTEALQAVLNFGFNEMNLHRIQALVAKENTASIKLLNRYQFLKEGTIREDYVVESVNENSECYSLLKWEWLKKKL
ncbi:GNAT family protein [Myroides sp. JBRI-B21084]|uniref:GNAT family N-acetyltransferase n=1 Tax=Myroides sp. JBRI-B21084 TaxID=3119977 RepID=UPI0026E26919|nr:GNAT family protein [Paenimyroides cloacae]WKW47556.1 GNAT family protein [Paenimyroides cloacae]